MGRTFHLPAGWKPIIVTAISAISLLGDPAAAPAADYERASPVGEKLMRLAQDASSQTTQERTTEAVLRRLIAELQQGVLDAAVMEPALHAAMQAQSQVAAALLGRLGPLQSIELMGSQAG